MLQPQLHRRGLLTGAAASAALGALAGRASAATGHTPEVNEVPQIELADECGDARRALAHVPFRAEFEAWLRDAADRFAQPVWAQSTTSYSTELRTAGLHPALGISLCGDMDINVHVTFNGVWWDILASMDVLAEQVDCGGWRNELFVPEAQQIRPSREACWRQDGFEWLLEWFNSRYMPATHLVLSGGGGWTDAKLVRGNTFSERRLCADNDLIQHVLSLHGAAA